LQYYQREYDHFHPLFSPEEQEAFVQLKRVLKDEGRGIVSATLTLYYSTVDDETLPDMIRTAHDSSRMRMALQKTPYWMPEAWRNFERATPALETALRALHRVGFAEYWTQAAKPRVEKRIAELAPDLPKYDVVPVIEKYLGFSLPSHTITIYLLAYSEPHGTRVSGLRFLTHISYPFGIVLHNAIHESMHPPYHRNDASVRGAIDLLGRDPLIMDQVVHHDPSFGYNSAKTRWRRWSRSSAKSSAPAVTPWSTGIRRMGECTSLLRPSMSHTNEPWGGIPSPTRSGSWMRWKPAPCGDANSDPPLEGSFSSFAACEGEPEGTRSRQPQLNWRSTVCRFTVGPRGPIFPGS
jgi:hypothetical protein